jgi:hypothetical protein
MKHPHAVLLLSLTLSLPLGAEPAEEEPLPSAAEPVTTLDRQQQQEALRQINFGRYVFRRDTFGNEAFWGGALRLHEAIAGRANGGVGPGLSPRSALGLGLKVDVDALPTELRAALRQGLVDLDDPATTLALLKLDSVVGVRGFFDETGTRLRSVGITCALCHSNVDDSLAPGVGHRRDGWAARDLDVGAIIAFSPSVQPFVDLLGLVDSSIDAATVRRVLRSWGPGKFDAELLMDGKAFRPDGKSAATLIPPASAWPASTCTPGRAGARSRTGTGSSPTSKCRAAEPSMTRGSTTPRSSRLPRWRVSATCATSPTA